MLQLLLLPVKKIRKSKIEKSYFVESGHLGRHAAPKPEVISTWSLQRFVANRLPYTTPKIAWLLVENAIFGDFWNLGYYCIVPMYVMTSGEPLRLLWHLGSSNKAHSTGDGTPYNMPKTQRN